MLIIKSSPRNNGVSSQVIDEIKPLFENLEIIQYNVYSLSVSPCTDCKYCEHYNGCSQHDLDMFFKNFEKANYILFVTPIYNNFFPAPLKALIDRFQRYFNARFKRGINPPIEIHKNVGVIITSGSNARSSADYMINTLKQTFAVINGTILARYYIPNTDLGISSINKVELQKFAKLLVSE